MNNQLEIYVLRDQKLDCFMNPMFMQARGQVLRMLSDQINNVAGAPRGELPMVALHPEDFELFLIGVYDAKTGEISVDKPVSVCLCKDLLVPNN